MSNSLFNKRLFICNAGQVVMARAWLPTPGWRQAIYFWVLTISNSLISTPLSAQTACKLYANTSEYDSIPQVFEIHVSTMTLYPLSHCFGRSQLPNVCIRTSFAYSFVCRTFPPCRGRTAAGWTRRMRLHAGKIRQGNDLPSANNTFGLWKLQTLNVMSIPLCPPEKKHLKETSGVKWIWDMFSMITSLNVRWRAKNSL